jgi:hypothetical protein
MPVILQMLERGKWATAACSMCRIVPLQTARPKIRRAPWALWITFAICFMSQLASHLNSRTFAQMMGGDTVSHGHAALGVSTPQSTFYDSGRFGRLFPTLPPFASDTPLIRDALAELGSVKGLMDAEDDLSIRSH